MPFGAPLWSVISVSSFIETSAVEGPSESILRMREGAMLPKRAIRSLIWGKFKIELMFDRDSDGGRNSSKYWVTVDVTSRRKVGSEGGEGSAERKEIRYPRMAC